MSKISTEQTIQTYGIENWGAGYFGINRLGHLTVRPTKNGAPAADVKAIVDYLISRCHVKPPLLLRFPQIIASQIRELHLSFAHAMREFGYRGEHLAVYPMKVNPRRDVVEAFLQEGSKYNYGLEVGTKAELYAALAFEQAPESLLVCNGFKDETFIEMAFLASQIGKRTFVVIEKLNELASFVRLASQAPRPPLLGVRVKLYSRGSGRWEKSGGETAKFGLTTTETLEVIKRLREHQRLDALKMLHCHIGSQITDIRRIKNAIREAARVYTKMRKMGVDIRYLNVGGGIGVDYDGSHSSFESSANYTIQEFANDVVYTISSICADENVPEPIIVTESGRVLTAHHAMIVVNVQDEIETVIDEIAPTDVDEDDPQVILELRDLRDHITSKNYREYYHDALEHKDELVTLFNLGYIDLEDRAKGEVLFWQILERVEYFLRHSKAFREEVEELQKLLAAKYLCNFSVFRCVPDAWALDHLFPILPIHKLNEPPTETATLVDLTCDSDGIIDRFVDVKDVKEVLEVHPFTHEPYYLAILLVGAYQEAMGNFHNLLGTLNEAHILIDDEGGFHVQKIVPGHHLEDVLALARYDRAFLLEGFRRTLERAIKRGELSDREGAECEERYRACARKYTYLE